MCCDKLNANKAVAQCIDCEEDVDEYGDAVNVCGYSPVTCSVCEAAPCDGSC